MRKQKHEDNIIETVLVSFLLNLHKIRTFFVSIVDFEQVNAGWATNKKSKYHSFVKRNLLKIMLPIFALCLYIPNEFKNNFFRFYLTKLLGFASYCPKVEIVVISTAFYFIFFVWQHHKIYYAQHIVTTREI